MHDAKNDLSNSWNPVENRFVQIKIYAQIFIKY